MAGCTHMAGTHTTTHQVVGLDGRLACDASPPYMFPNHAHHHNSLTMASNVVNISFSFSDQSKGFIVTESESKLESKADSKKKVSQKGVSVRVIFYLLLE